MRNIFSKKIKTKKGSALVFALGMVIVIAMILTSLITYITAQISFSRDRVERERAFQISEAGVYYYRWYLAHQISGKTAEQIKDFWENGNPTGVGTSYVAEFSDPESGAVGEYKLEVQKPALGSTIVIAKSTGWTYNKPNAKRVVQVRFRRPSWSENAVLANDNMRFGSGTTITGKIHSNLGIRFDGVATNIVSSALQSYDDPDHCEVAWRWDGSKWVCDFSKNEFGVHTHANAPPGSGVNDNFRPLEAPPNAAPPQRTDVFQAGRKLLAGQLVFSSVVSDISFMRSQANIKFDNSGDGRRIILKTDGNMDVCKVNDFSASTNAITNYSGVTIGAAGSYAATNGTVCSSPTTACCNAMNTCNWISNSNHDKGKCLSMTTYAIPDNGIIFTANNIWIEGTINLKKVTIVAAELTDEPGYTGGNKSVYLGMNNLLYTNFDGKDIIGVIAQKDVEVIKDSQNVLTIDAALLAKDGRVGRVDYGNTKSTITVNGSIATYSRYGFAYTDGTGYQIRNINFDNNLLYYPPPYFPTGTEYSIDLWDEL